MTPAEMTAARVRAAERSRANGYGRPRTPAEWSALRTRAERRFAPACAAYRGAATPHEGRRLSRASDLETVARIVLDGLARAPAAARAGAPDVVVSHRPYRAADRAPGLETGNGGAS